MRNLSSKLRILLSAQHLMPGNGGISTVARMTAMALAPDHDMIAIACEDSEDHTIGGVPVRGFAGNRFSFVLGNLGGALRSSHVIYDFPGTARAQMALRFARRPNALWIHGWEVWGDMPEKYRGALAGASLILSNSRYTLERAGSNIPAHVPVEICPLATMQDDAPPRSSGEHAPTVLLLGRVDELFAKGHDLLIEVWPQVMAAEPRARLLFVGGGPQLGRLRDMAARSPVRAAITVAGHVPEADLKQYWQMATIFAMPGFAEGFGLVYADAMRHGLPIIASREDAGQEINQDGVTGFNIARADRKGLADALVTLLRDKTLAYRLGQAGQVRWRERYRFSVFQKRLRQATRQFLEIP